MNPFSIQSLATGFTVGGVILGVPSGATLLLYVIHLVHQRMKAAPAAGSFGENPDAILLMLKAMTSAIGGLARLAGSVGQFLFNGLAMVAGVALILSIALWFTGRGLHANAPWARGSAYALLILAMLPSLGLTLAVPGVARVLPLFMLTACLLGLHALWAGHFPQPQ